MKNQILHCMAYRQCMVMLLMLLASLSPVRLMAGANLDRSRTSEMNVNSDNEPETMDYYAVYNPTDNMVTFKKCAKMKTDGNNYTLFDDFLKNRGNIYYQSVKKIVIEESFKSYRVESCSHLFQAYSSLVSIEGLEYLNTEKVKDMSNMFCGCYKLQSLDLSKMNTENVTDMSRMFYDCNNLQTLNISNFSTANVTDMSWMFCMCKNLQSLDLSAFNTANVTNMEGMFGSCEKLRTLDVSRFNTTKVTDMSSMFSSCSSLQSLELAAFNTENVVDMQGMFSSCRSLQSLDLSNFNTTKVTNMYFMFDWCDNLQDLEISKFKTANVTDMRGMFYGCHNLESIDVSNFNTEKVERMLNMFGECRSLRRLDISSFTFRNVTTMQNLFYDCEKLADITFPKEFDTGNVTNMAGMFRMCKSLKSIDLSGLNTSNVTEMYGLFENCSELKSLSLSNFQTVNVRDMSKMFAKCGSIQSLDLEGFNTTNVVNMDEMFSGCSSLRYLDASSFETMLAAKNNRMYDMFKDCALLKTIYVSDQFEAEGVKYSDDMFAGCESLPNYNSSTTDATMANYKTGYFKTYYKTGNEIHPMYGERLEVENLLLADGEDFKTYAPFTAGQAEYTRKMENTWGTLCLPYAISPMDVEGGKLYRMEGINDNALSLKEVDAKDLVEAGEAVLIKRIGDSGSNIRISTSNSEVVKAPISGNSDEARLVGTFSAMQVPDDAYAIAKDKFWLVSDVATEGKSVWTAGMRAYIQPAKGSQSQPSALSISDGNATTSIDMLNAASDGKAEIFDINGRKQNSLQKGLNIIRQAGVTKKVYIK